jgi:integrase
MVRALFISYPKHYTGPMTQISNPPLPDHPLDGEGESPMKDNVQWLAAIGLATRFGPDWPGKRCLAKTRGGTECQRPAITGSGRCRLHGGWSTGPRTEEGRARISAANTKHGRKTKERLAEAKPLLREDLFAVLGAMGETVRDDRDRALLLIGFAGGFRRTEVCAINCRDVERVRQGLIITLRRSKTDQEGAGRKIGIPFGRTKWCPVTALERWLKRACVSEGPIFRPVDRHGAISLRRLSGEAVCLVVRERLAAAGYDPRPFSGHSLRAGLVTSAAQAGAPTWKIRQQTGHASEAMLVRYIRDGELFVDNAAGALL